MNAIKEDYVSFEIAKLLKEKGFDIPVRYEYHCVVNDNQKPQFHRLSHNFNGEEYSGLNSKWYSAPTLQMACKWLREEKLIHIAVIPIAGNGFISFIYDVSDSYVYRIKEEFGYYHHPEEAIEAAIKYTLENLN